MGTLKASMELAGQCCLAWLDGEKDYMPTGGYEVAHDVGRWWDAMLRLEAATRFVIPGELEGAMLRNLQLLTSNPDGLLMNSPDVPWLKDAVRINPHNLREGMLAFNALVRYRNSRWAEQAGHGLLETIDRILQEDGRLDFSQTAVWGSVPHTEDPSHTEPAREGWFDATGTSGRCLEAIVWFYEATGDPLALRLADRIARHHLAASVNADGSMRQEIVDPENVGHNHSYLGTLRGLLLFGLLTGQDEYVDAVTATYRKALFGNVITESGWTPHDLGKSRFPNEDGDAVAETASCGDAVQLALWLALRAGQADLLDDVQRLMRARILPAQILESDDPRQRGAWGCHGHPYGRGCILDVLAAVLHTCCDVFEHAVTRIAQGVQINLHLDGDFPLARVTCRRGQAACLTIEPKTPGNTLVRIPGWAPRESVGLSVEDESLPLVWIGDCLHIARDAAGPGRPIVIEYGLPGRTSVERMPVSGKEFTLSWRGDEVVVAEPAVPIYAASPAD